MREVDANFGAYEHLHYLPRADEALHMLRLLASMVKPIMRKRGWRVGALSEFLPDDRNLQGLNINRGQRICVRLRYTHDPSLFLHLEQICDTLLHELSHIVWGPHDANFHKLWDELRDEHETLLMKGFTGEGFLSKGHRLGGNVSKDEAQRRARAAAQKRAEQNKRTAGSGQKLGGTPPIRIPGFGIRNAIADAVTRRNTITEGCASGRQDAEKMAREAQRNGFRTKAEEDDANQLAIANALIELMEQDESRQRQPNASASASASEIPRQPRPAPVTWNSGGLEEGLRWNPETGLELAEERPQATSSAPPQIGGGRPEQKRPAESRQRDRGQSVSNSNTPPSQSKGKGSEIIDLTISPPSKRPARLAPTRPGKPVSRLVKEDEERKTPKTPKTPLQPSLAPQRAPRTSEQTQKDNFWECSTCTLNNHKLSAVCEACESPRPDLGHFWWACMQCGFSANEKRMWSCRRCGQVKATS